MWRSDGSPFFRQNWDWSAEASRRASTTRTLPLMHAMWRAFKPPCGMREHALACNKPLTAWDWRFMHFLSNTPLIVSNYVTNLVSESNGGIALQKCFHHLQIPAFTGIHQGGVVLFKARGLQQVLRNLNIVAEGVADFKQFMGQSVEDIRF